MKFVLDCINNIVIGLDEWLLILFICLVIFFVFLNFFRVCVIIVLNVNVEWVYNGFKYFICCFKWVILWMFMVLFFLFINNIIFIID